VPALTITIGPHVMRLHSTGGDYWCDTALANPRAGFCYKMTRAKDGNLLGHVKSKAAAAVPVVRESLLSFRYYHAFICY
jgi:hypothetical protein